MEQPRSSSFCSSNNQRQRICQEWKQKLVYSTDSFIYTLIRLLSQFDELGAENGTVTGYDLKHFRFLPGG